MKRSLIALAVAAAAVTPFAAQAQDSGDWIVRARALNLASDNGGSTNPDLALSVNDKWFPEVDISYFFTPNIAAELILTYPQQHDVKSAGTKIGTFKHLPPTLLAQYHFTGMSFRPYVGLGVNYTLISDVKWDPAVQGVYHQSIENDSFGLAAQVGVDIPVGGGWLINVDVKKVQIGTDVYSAGTKVGDLKVDPWLMSVGVGMRF
jgi:outer membrane protein